MASDLPLRQLEQEHGGRDVERVEVRATQRGVLRPDEARRQPVEVPVAVLLVQLEVRGRVKGDVAVSPAVRPDPQRDLLRHRARGHEHGGGLPEESRHVRLEPLERLAPTVVVPPLVLPDLGDERGHRRLERLAAVPEEEPRAAPEPPASLLVRHRCILRSGECGRFRGRAHEP
jgi:hypothetical protein